jgi:GTP-binding protein EngB required for normal cell division
VWSKFLKFVGKIQALKKSATKGDKKKKKEVQEEIVKLETEMDKRHEEELAEVSTSSNNANVSKIAMDSIVLKLMYYN